MWCDIYYFVAHNYITPLMPSSHLACDGTAEPVSCPYPPFRAEAGGGCEIFVRIHGLRGLYDLV